MNDELNLPKILYQITGTFEYELLIELLLRNFNHPLADDTEFRNTIIETVAELLNRASKGETFGNMQASHTNIVYSVWFVESDYVKRQSDPPFKEQRLDWLNKIKRSMPSCFCSQDLLS